MRNYFIFNGRDSREYGVYISGGGTYGAPSRDFNTVEIPGRDGVFLEDNGRYNSVIHWYEANIVHDFSSNIEKLRNMLMGVVGFADLEDSYHPDEIYKAYYQAGLEPKVISTLRGGTFRLEFTRQPQRYLKSGRETIRLSASGTITNPTPYPAAPKIVCYAISENPQVAASMDIQIGKSMRFRVPDVNWGATVYTDELIYENSYTGRGFLTPLTISGQGTPLGLPRLEPGDNSVYVGAYGLSPSAVFTPNWYIL